MVRHFSPPRDLIEGSVTTDGSYRPENVETRRTGYEESSLSENDPYPSNYKAHPGRKISSPRPGVYKIDALLFKVTRLAKEFCFL
jgi:hypothetical protein